MDSGAAPTHRFETKGAKASQVSSSTAPFSHPRSEQKPTQASHHGGHQEEDADAETGQGERHRPGRAGRDGQEGGGGQMQAGGRDGNKVLADG